MNRILSFKSLYVLTIMITALALLSLFTQFGLGVINVKNETFFFGHGDWLFHFAVFHVAAWLLVPFSSFIRIGGWIALISIGVLSEIAQALWLEGRSGNIEDASVNVFAVFAAIALYSLSKVIHKR